MKCQVFPRGLWNTKENNEVGRNKGVSSRECASIFNRCWFAEPLYRDNECLIYLEGHVEQIPPCRYKKVHVVVYPYTVIEILEETPIFCIVHDNISWRMLLAFSDWEENNISWRILLGFSDWKELRLRLSSLDGSRAFRTVDRALGSPEVLRLFPPHSSLLKISRTLTSVA